MSAEPYFFKCTRCFEKINMHVGVKTAKGVVAFHISPAGSMLEALIINHKSWLEDASKVSFALLSSQGFHRSFGLLLA